MKVNQSIVESTTQQTIVSGPSKAELTLALFDSRCIVTFIVGDDAALISAGSGQLPAVTGTKRVAVVINAVERESGDDENWNFRGFVPDGTGNVQGFYCTSRKRGRLTLTARQRA